MHRVKGPVLWVGGSPIQMTSLLYELPFFLDKADWWDYKIINRTSGLSLRTSVMPFLDSKKNGYQSSYIRKKERKSIH